MHALGDCPTRIGRGTIVQDVELEEANGNFSANPTLSASDGDF